MCLLESHTGIEHPESGGEPTGVKESFLYDPTSDYPLPPLRGFRLAKGEVRRLRTLFGGQAGVK